MKWKTKLSRLLEHSLLLYFSKTAKYRRPKEKQQKILVARTDGMGDYILWLEAEQKLRDIFPDACIELMFDARKPTEELAKWDETINSFFSVNIVTWRRFLSIWSMRYKQYDLILQPVYSRLAFTDILLFAAKAKKRITLDTNGQFLSSWEKRISDQGYDQIIPCSEGVRHELIRNAELIRGLGISDYRAGLPGLAGLHIDKKSLSAKPYIILFPSGSWSLKLWPAEKYVEVIKWLLQYFPGEIYLCGDEKDKEICNWIVLQFSSEYRLHSLAGKLDLAELAAYLGNAFLVLGNDTGGIHLAAAAGSKTLVIVAEREIGRFFPYETEVCARPEKKEAYEPVCIHQPERACSGCLLRGITQCINNQSMEEPFACIKEIPVSMVLGELKKIIG